MLDREHVQLYPAPRALIVPHAGYRYSGPVAAAAYARLLPHGESYSSVVVLGPCHQVAVRGIATSSASAFRTPLGDVPLGRGKITRLRHPAICQSDAAHLNEHSIEVQLPFLQLVLRSFSLIPLLAGDVSAAAVAEVIRELWDRPETLVIVSSDLSHYLAFDEAKRIDKATCEAIEQKRFEQIRHADACGAKPLAALLEVANERGLHVTTLDLRNSGDTAGGKGRVVGYGAWMLLEEPPCEKAA